MAVTVAINSTTLNPQPSSVDWESPVIAGKLDGTDAVGAYQVVTLRAPVDAGGTANWNWSSFENSVLTSIVLPARFETMKEATGTTYSAGAVAKRIKTIQAPPGGLVRGVEMQVLVVV